MHVIIGSGIAAVTAAENIRKHDSTAPISIYTEEIVPYYYRPRLMDVIAGSVPFESIVVRKLDWFKKQNIDFNIGVRIERIDPAKKNIIDQNGKIIPFDRLLIATGASPIKPCFPGSDDPDVLCYRDKVDADRICEVSLRNKRVLIIGSGSLGLEAASALAKRGVHTELVEFMPRLFSSLLDEQSSQKFYQALQDKGYRIRLGEQVNRVERKDKTTLRVTLKSGETHETGFIIAASGARPNIMLAAESGIKTSRGILVDERMETNHSGIFSAGDVAEFNRVCYGLYTPAREQGMIAGLAMLGQKASWKPGAYPLKLKIDGIDLERFIE